MDICKKLNNYSIAKLNMPILVSIYVFLYMLQKFLGSYICLPFEYDGVENVFIAIELVLAAYLIVKDFLTGSIFAGNKIIFIVLLFITVLSRFFTSSNHFLELMLLCYVIKDQDLKDVFKLIVLELLILFVIGFICYVVAWNLNLIEHEVFYRTIADGARYSLGLGHPNGSSLFISNLMAMILYLKHKDIKKFWYLIFAAILTVVYIPTRSKTGLLIGLITLILFFALDMVKDNKQRIFNKVSSVIFPASFVIFFILLFLYEKDTYIGKLADTVLTTRLYMTSLAIEYVKPTFWGSSVTFSTLLEWPTVVVDSLYPYLFLKAGSVWLIIISAVFFLVSKKCRPEDSLLIIIFSIVSFVEHSGLNLLFVMGLIVFKYIFSAKTDTKDNRNVN